MAQPSVHRQSQASVLKISPDLAAHGGSLTALGPRLLGECGKILRPNSPLSAYAGKCVYYLKDQWLP